MIEIDLLKNKPYFMAECAAIWIEVLGKIWIPDRTLEQSITSFTKHLNEDSLPLTLVAYEGERPVGMASLRENDGIRPDIGPWMGALVVDPAYQNRGIGQKLIEATKQKARDLGFKDLYLFALDLTVPDYYAKLGWTKMGMDEYAGHPVTVMQVVL